MRCNHIATLEVTGHRCQTKFWNGPWVWWHHHQWSPSEAKHLSTEKTVSGSKALYLDPECPPSITITQASTTLCTCCSSNNRNHHHHPIHHCRCSHARSRRPTHHPSHHCHCSHVRSRHPSHRLSHGLSHGS